jgi:hypothetical protein
MAVRPPVPGVAAGGAWGRRELAGLSGAIVAHGAVFACLAGSPPSVPVPVEAPRPVEIDVEETAPEKAPALPTSTAIPTSTPTSTSTSIPTPTPTSTPTSPSLPLVAALSPAALPPLDLSSAPPLSADQLGLGGRHLFLGPLSEPPAASAPPPSPEGTPNVAPGAQQSLRDALRAHDHALGLDVGGPIVAVAEEIVRPSDTPVDSHAVFQITADAGGNVTSVVLLDASQGRGAWERVASNLAGALRSRRLTMRGHAGAVITLDVTSRWAMPSGSKPRQPFSRPHVGPSGAGLTYSMAFDVTDIGARPLRSVHARILGEKLP